MMMYLIDGPPNKVSQIWTRFTPDRQIGDRIGIVSVTELVRIGLTRFFDMSGSWFEWYFLAFDKCNLEPIEKAALQEDSMANRADPFSGYGRFSVRCNRDMRQTEVLVYDNELFDPMIELLHVLGTPGHGD